MTPNEYQKLAMRTKSNNFNDGELMLNAALGLAGEAAEYLEAVSDENIDSIKKELGDLEWYVALICEVCSIDLDILISSRKMIDVPQSYLFSKEIFLSPSCGKLCDYVKKVYFQGHELSQKEIFTYLLYIQVAILEICETRGFDIEEIWQLNIDKLLKRYPDGFKIQDSINRSGSDV